MSRAAWHAEVPFLRSAELATADATSVDVALDMLDRLASVGRRFRAVILVQPTSPLTDPRDIRAAVARFDAEDRDVVSIAPSHEARFHISSPQAAPSTETLEDRDADTGQILSGGFYVVSPDRLRLTRRFVTPETGVFQTVHADRAIDIDVETDFVLAEALAAARPVRGSISVASASADRAVSSSPRQE